MKGLLIGVCGVVGTLTAIMTVLILIMVVSGEGYPSRGSLLGLAVGNGLGWLAFALDRDRDRRFF